MSAPYVYPPNVVNTTVTRAALDALAEHVARREREAAAIGWDAAVAAMQYPDGTPVEIVSSTNPYRIERGES